MKRLLFPAATILVILVLLGLTSSRTTANPLEITPLPPVENPDGRAGACFSYYPNEGNPPHPYLPMALDAGSRWDRFDFIWPNIEPSYNSWNYASYDNLVNDLTAEGMNIIGILLWTPDWASTSGVRGLAPPSFNQRPLGWNAPDSEMARMSRAPTARSSPPEGLEHDWYESNNYWGHYVYNVVSHYSAMGVTHWEMWNEVDDGDWDYFWTGSEADYARLLTVGYQATKAACPDCTVLYAGLLFWADPQYFESVLDILNEDPDAPANNYYFDVMSVHLYSRSSNIYDTVNHIRAQMTNLTADHPIWLTETGVPVWNDVPTDPNPIKLDYTATLDEAAQFTIQSYANAWASGVERYLHFRVNDADMIDPSYDYYGLIRNDYSLRPSYVAYQVATTYMVTPTMATSWTYGGGTRRVTLWGTPRGKLSVLWNTTPTSTTFAYPATLPTATLIDRWGATQTITATNGVYTLPMPGATANLVSNPGDYFIGGEPYLVLEADTTPPTISMHALPPETYTHPPTVSWEGDDDAAGIWGFEVQVKTGGGNWAHWLSLAQTIGITTSNYTNVQDGESYCFRARAWDNAGNISEWSPDDQACTTFHAKRTTHFDLGAVYGDADGNAVWDQPGEITTTVSLRFVDSGGADAITPTISSSWEFTTSLALGDYVLLLTPTDWWSPSPGWLPRQLPIEVTQGEGTQEISIPELGLLPHVSSNLFPLVFRDS